MKILGQNFLPHENTLKGSARLVGKPPEREMPANGNARLNSPERIKAAGPYLHLCQFGNYSSALASPRPESDAI